MAGQEHVRPAEREQRALRASMAVSLGIGIVALAWGLAAGSQVILLDGVYVVLGLALSWLGLYASKAVASGPTPRFPFGRESLVPFVVAVQGLALSGTLVYAAAEAVRVILDGGSQVAAVDLVAYGGLSGLIALVAWAYLQRRESGSDLLRAEAAAWLAGAATSLVIAVGAAVVLVLHATPLRTVEPYTDSVLVLMTCVLLAPVPLRMLRRAAGELLVAAPEPTVEQKVRDIVERVRVAEGLPVPVLRTSKVAGKLIVEAGFVVPEGTWDVSGADRVRRAMYKGLADLPYEPWLVVELTTDPELVA